MNSPKVQWGHQQEWTVRDLTHEPGAYNGVRWWAEWALEELGGIAPSGAVLFPERRDVGGEVRRRVLLEAAVGVASVFRAFGAKAKSCQVVRVEDLPTAYRGVGALSPVLLSVGVAPEKWVDFAKAVCAAAKEEKAVVYPGGDGALWWLEKCRGEEECGNPNVGKREEKEMEMADGSESVVRESLRCEEWLRKAGRVVVARVRVEDWNAPEGVFRSALLKAKKERGSAGMVFVLRWERKGAEAGKAEGVVERALAVAGLTVEEVRDLVADVPGVVCREVEVAAAGAENERWLEEVFGERPEVETDGEWVLVEAGYVEPPRPSMFGWHDRYLPIRGKAGSREESEVVVPMSSKVHAVSLLQWMGPRSWVDKAEERQVPERFEKVLREGHHAWFRVATGEGVPTSRCWMVFNEPGEWNYWRQYGVTRVLDVCPEGCRGYWSADGKQWWQVEACAPRGKRVHVRNAKAAYRAACGEMPWEVLFFDGSEKNRDRLERMYAYMAGVLGRAGLEDATVSRRLETAATSRSGFSRWANRGMLYGGRFGWEKEEVW